MDGYDTPNELLPEPCDPNWEVESEPEWSYYEQGEQYVQKVGTCPLPLTKLELPAFWLQIIVPPPFHNSDNT